MCPLDAGRVPLEAPAGKKTRTGEYRVSSVGGREKRQRGLGFPGISQVNSLTRNLVLNLTRVPQSFLLVTVPRKVNRHQTCPIRPLFDTSVRRA